MGKKKKFISAGGSPPPSSPRAPRPSSRRSQTKIEGRRRRGREKKALASEPEASSAPFRYVGRRLGICVVDLDALDQKRRGRGEKKERFAAYDSSLPRTSSGRSRCRASVREEEERRTRRRAGDGPSSYACGGYVGNDRGRGKKKGAYNPAWPRQPVLRAPSRARPECGA